MGLNNPSGSGAWTQIFNDSPTSGRFDITSIPASYNLLFGSAMLRTDQAISNDLSYIYFNGDFTDTNYKTGHHVGGSLHAIAETDYPLLSNTPGASAEADHFVQVQFLIAGYANASIRKMARSISGVRFELTGNDFVYDFGINWESNNAIDRITIQPNGYSTDEFVSGCSLQLWGIL